MPNIIFYGITGAEFYEKLSKVEKALKVIGAEKETVATLSHQSVVLSCDGKQTSRPYCEIRSDNKDHFAKIAAALFHCGINMDIEMVLIHKFIPKCKEKTEETE